MQRPPWHRGCPGTKDSAGGPNTTGYRRTFAIEAAAAIRYEIARPNGRPAMHP